MVILKIAPDAECPICLYPFLVKGATQGKAMTGGKCEHAFCRPCFRKWWATSPSCPICRESLIVDQPILVVPIPPKPLIDLTPSKTPRRLCDTEGWRKIVTLSLRPLLPTIIRPVVLVDMAGAVPCSSSSTKELSLTPLTPIVLPFSKLRRTWVVAADYVIVQEEVVGEKEKREEKKDRKRSKKTEKDLLLPVRRKKTPYLL